MIWPPGARPGGAVSVRAGFGVTVPCGPNRAGAFGPITVVSLLGRQLVVTGRGSLLGQPCGLRQCPALAA